jgi:hypothetical protein
LKTLTEIVLILVEVNVVAIVTVGCVCERPGILVIRTPTILAIGLASAKAFLVTIVHGASQKLGAILVGLVVTALPGVTIIRGTIILVAKVL